MHVALGQLLFFFAVLLDQFLVLKSNRLNTTLQIYFLFQLVLEVLLKILDFLNVHGQFAYAVFQSRALPLEQRGFLLFVEHNRLQFLATVIELAALILQDLSSLVHLHNSSFDHSDFVAKLFLRLQLLLSKLALQGGDSPLVAHLVLNNRRPHRVKRKGGPPRTIKFVSSAHSEFCLRSTPHL